MFREGEFFMCEISVNSIIDSQFSILSIVRYCLKVSLSVFLRSWLMI